MAFGNLDPERVKAEELSEKITGVAIDRRIGGIPAQAHPHDSAKNDAGRIGAFYQNLMNLGFDSQVASECAMRWAITRNIVAEKL